MTEARPDTDPTGTSRRVGAVVVDDTTLVRDGLALVQQQIEVVAAYSTIEPVLINRPEADVVILDLHLTGPDNVHVRQGRVAIRALTRAGYRVCVYTDERRRYVLAACLKAGASGVVHKSEPLSDAVSAFLAVAEGQTVITRSLIGLGEILEREGRLPELTRRQRQILAARARGESWHELATRLYISEATARDHLGAITRKIADYFQSTTPGDIEHDLGLAPGDLFDVEDE